MKVGGPSQAYWPFHRDKCKRNEFADLLEHKEPNFAQWMRQHGKQAVLKDDEVDRLERAAAASSGTSRQEVFESMYGRLAPKPQGLCTLNLYATVYVGMLSKARCVFQLSLCMNVVLSRQLHPCNVACMSVNVWQHKCHKKHDDKLWLYMPCATTTPGSAAIFAHRPHCMKHSRMASLHSCTNCGLSCVCCMRTLVCLL